MNQAPSPRSSSRLAPLDAMLDRLEPALTGYPVKELVALWVEARDDRSVAAGQLVELCISSWIARLDADGEPVPVNEEALGELQVRHRCARHALALLRMRVRRSAVVPLARRTR